MRREREARPNGAAGYDQFIKASYVFNLLDACGVISVTELQSYILRVCEPAKACGQCAWLATPAGNSRTHVWDRKSSQPFISGARAAGSQGCAIKIMVRCCCIKTRRQMRRV